MGSHARYGLAYAEDMGVVVLGTVLVGGDAVECDEERVPTAAGAAVARRECLPACRSVDVSLCVCVCLSVYVVAGGAEALAAAGTTLLRAAKASLHPALKLLGDLAAH